VVDNTLCLDRVCWQKQERLAGMMWMVGGLVGINGLLIDFRDSDIFDG
jgi:hypothetical protein